MADDGGDVNIYSKKYRNNSFHKKWQKFYKIL